jgi:hypothetical protein
VEFWKTLLDSDTIPDLGLNVGLHGCESRLVTPFGALFARRT